QRLLPSREDDTLARRDVNDRGRVRLDGGVRAFRLQFFALRDPILERVAGERIDGHCGKVTRDKIIELGRGMSLLELVEEQGNLKLRGAESSLAAPVRLGYLGRTIEGLVHESRGLTDQPSPLFRTELSGRTFQSE